MYADGFITVLRIKSCVFPQKWFNHIKWKYRHSSVQVWLISSWGRDPCPNEPEKGGHRWHPAPEVTAPVFNIWTIKADMFWLRLWLASYILDSTRWSVSWASAHSRCTDTCVHRRRWLYPPPGRSKWCILRFFQQGAVLRQWKWVRQEDWEGSWEQSLEGEEENMWVFTQTTVFFFNTNHKYY